eukprot:scaffold33853_cov56-Isochrysis_galbana.AAC.1
MLSQCQPTRSWRRSSRVSARAATPSPRPNPPPPMEATWWPRTCGLRLRDGRLGKVGCEKRRPGGRGEEAARKEGGREIGRADARS